MVTKASPIQNIIKNCFYKLHRTIIVRRKHSNSIPWKLLTRVESNLFILLLSFVYSFFFTECTKPCHHRVIYPYHQALLGFFNIFYQNICILLSPELLFNVFWNFYISSVCLTLSNVVFVSFVNVMFIFKWEHQENKNTEFPKSE